MAEEGLPRQDELPGEDDFLAVLAQELRRPLAPLTNAARLLQLQPEPSGVDLEAAEIIGRQLRHLTRLIDDLHDVSRFVRGTIPLERGAVDLREIVGNAIDTVRPSIARRRHDLSLTIPSDPVRVDGDAQRLEQVVANLLRNAAAYTDDGGDIRIVLKREGKEAVIRVEDDGIGMTPETLARAFEPFVQGKRDPGRSTGGLGLGLTLSRILVELHGGRIEARSEGPGRGSELLVRLPGLKPEAVPESPAQDESPPKRDPAQRGEPPALRPLNLLVVDDQPDMTRTLESLLRLLGHRTRVAQTGKGALEEAGEDPPDIVFLDIGLPDMTGFEVASRMRSDPGLQETVLVAMTGYGGDVERAKAYQAGFDHHLVKPLEMEVLRQILRERSEPPTGPGPTRSGSDGP